MLSAVKGTSANITWEDVVAVARDEKHGVKLVRDEELLGVTPNDQLAPPRSLHVAAAVPTP